MASTSTTQPFHFHLTIISCDEDDIDFMSQFKIE
jgi:hypothetical protein